MKPWLGLGTRPWTTRETYLIELFTLLPGRERADGRGARARYRRRHAAPPQSGSSSLRRGGGGLALSRAHARGGPRLGGVGTSRQGDRARHSTSVTRMELAALCASPPSTRASVCAALAGHDRTIDETRHERDLPTRYFGRRSHSLLLEELERLNSAGRGFSRPLAPRAGRQSCPAAWRRPALPDPTRPVDPVGRPPSPRA